jgi:hypothetical protein
MTMKKLFEKINAGTTGLLFQTTVQFTPLSNSTNLGSSLSSFFNNNGNLAGFFNAAFNVALSVGAILAVLRIAYAGWLYMGAADMWGSKQHAKEVLTGAILGLLLLLGIWIILDQINPNILNLNILQTIQGAPNTAPTTGTGAQTTANANTQNPAATENLNGVPVNQANQPLSQ